MIQISSGFLGTFKECMRCAWLEKNKKVKRTRGKFPSLPSGMDSAFKSYSDSMREKNVALPEITHPKLKGFTLFNDPVKMKAWRQWNAKAALKVETEKWKLVGGLDEVFYCAESGLYVPADYKTASDADRSQEDADEYHQIQLDIYDFMLSRNGHKTAGFGVIMLWAPLSILNGMAVQFVMNTIIVETNPARALALCEKAVACIESPIMPPAGHDCEYCKYAGAVNMEMPAGVAA